ncbi:MAG TPA: hypothetical protein VJ044_13785 [Candidatus Hodarchaeales archaeon]|nr:hypothetical protein [Candidatus Hodarchaeales archaeon]
MPKINQSVVRSFPFPLLPLAEQNQIVARVNQLMRLCDELDIRLTQTQTLGEVLTDAIIRQQLSA